MEVPTISEAVPVIEAAAVLHHDQAPFKLVVAEPSSPSRDDSTSISRSTNHRCSGVLAAAKLVLFMLATAVAGVSVLLRHQSSVTTLFPTWSVDSVEYSLFNVHWWRLRSSATLSANVRLR